MGMLVDNDGLLTPMVTIVEDSSTLYPAAPFGTEDKYGVKLNWTWYYETGQFLTELGMVNALATVGHF